MGKPNLYKSPDLTDLFPDIPGMESVWVCKGRIRAQMAMGEGSTPQEAYDDWRANCHAIVVR
jgi:maltose-binding protein MalE